LRNRFAAGWLLFVVGDKILLKTHSNGHERVATLGLVAGAVVMQHLDASLARRRPNRKAEGWGRPTGFAWTRSGR